MAATAEIDQETAMVTFEEMVRVVREAPSAGDCVTHATYLLEEIDAMAQDRHEAIWAKLAEICRTHTLYENLLVQSDSTLFAISRRFTRGRRRCRKSANMPRLRFASLTNWSYVTNMTY